MFSWKKSPVQKALKHGMDCRPMYELQDKQV